MRFTEAKRRSPLFLIGALICLGILLMLGFCHLEPTPQKVQKTIVFTAD